jgi:hypothetical protein
MTGGGDAEQVPRKVRVPYRYALTALPRWFRRDGRNGRSMNPNEFELLKVDEDVAGQWDVTKWHDRPPL